MLDNKSVWEYTLEQQRMLMSINEGKTILRGKLSKEKRIALERTIQTTEANLQKSLSKEQEK